MGEVYRATDTKLGRDVALKVLPAELAADPERLGRFEREARLLGSLNHPNVASIHGLEEVGSTRFLVLELVEGEDLSERLKRGPVAVEEAREIATQIAQALEAAHERGIVHRDLKPANVKLTPDGQVKVLDFGLARARAGEGAASGSSSSVDLSRSPTLVHSGTQAGMILGTAAYMSPEQARDSEGGGQAEELEIDGLHPRPSAWSAGGVLFVDRDGDIWTWALADHSFSPFLETPFTEGNAATSTDGRLVAYDSDETGRREIYVRTFPHSGRRWRVSTAGSG